MQVGSQSRADDQLRLGELLTRHDLTGWFQDRIGADTECIWPLVGRPRRLVQTAPNRMGQYRQQYPDLMCCQPRNELQGRWLRTAGKVRCDSVGDAVLQRRLQL